jgi:small subunit ribosomal protein S8
MMTDPIADMLARVRNASAALLPTVDIPHSQMKESIAKILVKAGYAEDSKISGDLKKTITITLKYDGREGVIKGLKRVSRPGLRQYVNAQHIPRVLRGLGTAILSTSRGVITGQDARKENVGGEVVCYVW